jgi:hypothetical protein
MSIPKPDDCIAAISVRFFANGALQVSGNVGDKKQALAMLAAAADSVRAQPDGMGRPSGIVTPSRDVVIPSPDPDFPIIPRGDMVRR